MCWFADSVTLLSARCKYKIILDIFILAIRDAFFQISNGAHKIRFA